MKHGWNTDRRDTKGRHLRLRPWLSISLWENELKATGIRVGLLINFGRTKVEYKRMVF